MQKNSSGKNLSTLLKNIAKLCALCFFAFVLLIGGVFLYYAKDLPRPERLSEVVDTNSTKIYDRTGQILLYEIRGEETHTFIPLSEIPENLKKAVIAIEDQRFYEHPGIDIKGVARAILADFRLLSTSQGGSTISQQLVRSMLLTRDKTVGRKVREFILTLELERKYTKDQILEFYLNQIPWGQNAYGIGSASQLYFGKTPKDISLEESATLAAMIQSPTFYSPFGSRVAGLLQRKDLVLSRMKDARFLSVKEVGTAQKTEIIFKKSSITIKAPHFSLDVLEQLVGIYGEEFLKEGGLTVTTSLDWRLQQIAEGAVQELADHNISLNANNEALVAINPATGEILAMVGSRNWFGESTPKGCTPGKDCTFDPKVNVATSFPGRQPGSSFKPFVYSVAFSKGYSDSFVVNDSETNFGIWGGKEYIPQNYDGKFRGPVTLRESLAQSLNIPSIKVLLDISGIQESINRAKEMGVTTLKDASSYGPALVLGGGEVRLLDMVSAYGVFATNGKKAYPVSILNIKDGKGKIIWENTTSSAQILDPEVCSTITSILSDNVARAPIFGTTSSLVMPGYPNVAVKTGTTQEYRDAWTIGYTENLVAGVWAGNSNNAEMSKAGGVTAAAPIWNLFMQRALPLVTP